MNRRKLVDSISREAKLARLGVMANIVYDRLILLTDEAGIAPGEPGLVKGEAFPLMDDIKTTQIEKALDALVEAEFLHRGEWRDRVVVCYPTESFKKHQGFREDYKRKFDFGQLSQRVWDEGLSAFRAMTAQEPCEVRTESVQGPHESVAMGTGSVTVTESVTDTGVACATVRAPKIAFEDFYERYPTGRKSGRKVAKQAFSKLTDSQKDKAVRAIHTFSVVYSLADESRRKYIPLPTTWLNQARYEDEPKAWLLDADLADRGPKFAKQCVYAGRLIYRDREERQELLKECSVKLNAEFIRQWVTPGGADPPIGFGNLRNVAMLEHYFEGGE